METSSPLAALQPSALPAPWGLHNDGFLGHPYAFGAQKLDFCRFRMRQPTTDYFLHRPVRGSSPTSTLAADLSQNCHIDQSPQLPTPRRNLFSTALQGVFRGKEALATPPVSSSSPGPENDSMDISPLPHKLPFLRTNLVEVQSPTPEPTPRSDDLDQPVRQPPSTVPEPVSSMYLEPPRPNVLQERKKNSLLRPSLARTKHYSTNSLSLRSVAQETTRPLDQENQMPSFQFGREENKEAKSKSVGLLPSFTMSPVQERSCSGPNLIAMGPPRPKANLQRQQSNCINGSPVGSGVRRVTGPAPRPRKQMRRSLSLFEHPDRFVLEQKKEHVPIGKLGLVKDLEESDILQLPHFFREDKSESVPRISQDTMLRVLDGAYDDVFEKTLVVDCRFEYEYKGGHIEGAVNFNDKDLLTKTLFDDPSSPRTLVILHCEYSQYRAPISASNVRQEDRKLNACQYPKLSYPDVYILDGGYSAFFSGNRNRCFPSAYIQMMAKEHEHACERGMGKVQRKKLYRAQTYAFGQHSPMSMDVNMEDSPTTFQRSVSMDSTAMDLCNEPMSAARRLSLNRRLLSY